MTGHLSAGRCVGRIDPDGPFLFTVVVKETFLLKNGNVAPSEEPEPLLEDAQTRASTDGRVDLPVRLPDLVPDKLAPDLIVLATARRSTPAQEAEVALLVGEREVHRLRLTGPRIATRVGERWELSPAEPWEQMPLSWDRAYGGTEQHTPEPDLQDVPELFRLPYPRNDLGIGFVTGAAPAPPDTMPMPCVELPDDRLTATRLLCPTPGAWHRQPRPGGWGWVEPHWFPRSVHWPMGAPWADPDAGPVPEEELGILPRGITARAHASPFENDVLRPEFFQEAVPALRLPGLDHAASIGFDGLEPARTAIRLPAGRPVVQLATPRRPTLPEIKLLTLVLDLDGGVLLRLWAAPLRLDGPELSGVPEDALETLEVELGYRRG